MISSDKVSSDSSSVSDVFSGYTNAINNLEDGSSWEGKSKENAVKQARNFVTEFSSPIEGQMNDFASALDKYEEYKQVKEEIENLENEKNNALNSNPETDVSSYDRSISSKEDEKSKLKSEIESLLSNVESKIIDITSSNAEVIDLKLGNFVNYYQGDYSNVSYGYGTSIASAGCGPTSMAMVLTYLTGDTIDPPMTADFSLKNGFRVEGNGTSWDYFPAIARKYNIECESSAPDASKVINDLSNGKVMILSMAPGDFTRGGHFIALRGITDNGQVIVADPASRERSSVTWDVNRVVSQAKNMWSFGSDLAQQSFVI